jgi:hypothetical protein
MTFLFDKLACVSKKDGIKNFLDFFEEGGAMCAIYGCALLYYNTSSKL